MKEGGRTLMGRKRSSRCPKADDTVRRQGKGGQGTGCINVDKKARVQGAGPPDTHSRIPGAWKTKSQSICDQSQGLCLPPGPMPRAQLAAGLWVFREE